MIRNPVVLTFALALMLMLPSQVSSVQPGDTVFNPACREHWGPYVDKIVYNIIDREDQQILALIDDEIDMIDHPINSTYFNVLLETENIMLETTPSNSYMAFIFNCLKFPFNITAFRRAFAYALNKEQMADTWSATEIQTASPLDAAVIKENPFSAEGNLDVNYTYPEIELANQSLEDAGFIDLDHDGYRESPEGTELIIDLEYFSETAEVVDACDEAIATFERIGIEARSRFNNAGFGWEDTDYGFRLHTDFDLAYYQYDFDGVDVDWLADEYWSEDASNPFINKPKFGNTTFDSYRDTLLHSVNYSDIRNAAIEMQKIIAYECPIVVSNELYDVYAYRTDNFEGYLNEIVAGPAGWYSVCQLHLQDALGGPYGGTFRSSLSNDLDSFNVLKANSFESGDLFRLLYDSLLKRYPDGREGPLLSRNWTIETHATNARITNGHTRFVFEMDPTSTWTDGVRCTAEDVIFSVNYYRELSGTWMSECLEDLLAAYVRDGDAVFEFDTESYWYLREVAFLPIIPKHVFQYIAVEDCLEYDPNPPIESMVTQGAFNISDYVSGEFIELTYFPDYYHLDPADIPLNLGAGEVIEYLFSYEVVWSVHGSYVSYEIYLDDELIQSSSGFVGTISSIGTGIITIASGEHSVVVVVTDYHGNSQSDTLEFNVPALNGIQLMGIVLAALGFIGLLIYRKKSKFERFQQKIIIPIFVTILAGGILFLFLADLSMQSRMWGGTYLGAIWDAWGIEIYPGFYLYYPVAIALLLISAVLYPVMVWLFRTQEDAISQSVKWFIIISGLFIPSMLILREPSVSYYTSYHLGITCSQLIAPAYTFYVGYSGGLMPNPYSLYSFLAFINMLYLPLSSLFLPSFLPLVIAFFFLLYENDSIGYRTFVLPVILLLGFSLYTFGMNLWSLVSTYDTFPVLYIPVLSYSLGMLILGQRIAKP